MDVIYFLIPLALILLAAAIGAFVWAVRSGQFDNLDREAYRILFDEDMVDTPPSTAQKQQPEANPETEASSAPPQQGKP